MAAGDTGVSICSDALLMLGAKSITSFNDGTDAASVCDRLYPDIRDSVLTTYPWTFNTKKVQLAQLITTPNSVWRYEYQLPGDRLGTVRAGYATAAQNAYPNKDVLKFDAIFAMKAVEFLNYALLIHDILEAERMEAERARRR